MRDRWSLFWPTSRNPASFPHRPRLPPFPPRSWAPFHRITTRFLLNFDYNICRVEYRWLCELCVESRCIAIKSVYHWAYSPSSSVCAPNSCSARVLRTLRMLVTLRQDLADSGDSTVLHVSMYRTTYCRWFCSVWEKSLHFQMSDQYEYILPNVTSSSSL